MFLIIISYYIDTISNSWHWSTHEATDINISVTICLVTSIKLHQEIEGQGISEVVSDIKVGQKLGSKYTTGTE